jgi:Flp pilus assembly pilin Flp
MLTNTHTYLTALLQNTLHGVRERLRDESGQTAAEYMGVIVLIAAILAAIAASGIGGALTDAIEGAIDKVFDSQG